MKRVTKVGVAAVLGVVASIVTGSAAFAQTAPAPYATTQAVTDSTTYIGQLTSGLVPIMLAIAGGIIGISILGWGLRTVFHKVRGAAHF